MGGFIGLCLVLIAVIGILAMFPVLWFVILFIIGLCLIGR